MPKYSAQNTNFSKLSKRVDDLNLLMVAVVIVLFIGFATMFVAATAMLLDGFRSKQASYEQLQSQVQSQNDKIDQLIKAKK
jgi:phosphate starvation-inducible membrane PsiE